MLEVRETTEEIIRRAKAGEPFDSLIKEYAQQAGEEAGAELLFHADSDQWAETFKQHVLALAVPGEMSPTWASTSCSIRRIIRAVNTR